MDDRQTLNTTEKKAPRSVIGAGELKKNWNFPSKNDNYCHILVPGIRQFEVI
jgi:hypothetical protein